MNRIVFVSFYTVQPCYIKEAVQLVSSLKKFRLEYDVCLEGNGNNWFDNVCYKPTFIKQMMIKHAEADAIVWVDADAVVEQKPVQLFQVEEDLAAVFYKMKERHTDGSGLPWEEELLTGTLFLRNTLKMSKVVDRWIVKLNKAVATLPREQLIKPEQEILMQLLPTLDVSVCRLPTEYCCIFDRPNWLDRGRQVVPIIRQHQMSRTHRGQ